MATKVKVQEIAVFGESGSGKTVLLSSFYGGTQEPSFRTGNSYRVLADDTTQGNRLKHNYLRMRNEAEAPETTRFRAEPYSFTIKPKENTNPDAAKVAGRSFGALRLVWHDYPGEWFTEEPSTDQEASRRIDTFRKLLNSDVALVLVDGQKLIDYSGEEERYLKSLFWGIREGLEKLKEDILVNGALIARFPRIWIVALSKADLHPSLTAQDFEDLIIQKAAGDLTALHETVRAFVQVPAALSLGEDFMLLSSARFEPGKIEVTKRVGLNLLLPVATMLPLERVAQWVDKFDVPLKMLGGLANRADEFMKVLTVRIAPFVAKLIAKIPKVGPALAPLTVPVVMFAVKLGKEKVEELHAQAIADKDYLAATITQFRLDLEHGVTEDVLVKSPW
ncbi:ATP/GTP-binding protein [Agromyces sp. NDB4Y10]|uniref:TRAFAC clade GTPase domain-containing protein n=1 Tax=Agromyces sp. NDB4Y10 TaxID=1775951 RepID=UPI001E31ACF3|nr:ATP/GTP-binding protein [Agromyces sp. NDB4Y10]